MPATPWIEVVGNSCESCGGPATFIIGNRYSCCDCYAGPGMGLISRAKAQWVHDYYQQHGRVPDDDEEFENQSGS